jgi:predicted peptidase
MPELTLPHYPFLVYEAQGGLEGHPLLLFLHGRGECGTNLAQVKTHGPPKLFPHFGLDRFSLLVPQCPEGQRWESPRLREFLASAIEQGRPDASRIYLSGISMGGFGVWDLAAAIPDRITAVAIVCGGGDPSLAASLTRVPVWLFHSAADAIVRVERGDQLFAALSARNAPVTYTRYRDADHAETWARAYGSNLVFDWLLQHTR